MKNSNEVTLPGIKIDKNLTFKKLNFAEEHPGNFILYVELENTLRKQNYLLISLLTVSLTMRP